MEYPQIPRDLLRKVENENFPLVGLRALVDLRSCLDELERAAMARAREMGASSTDIGDALGITRQAAYQRLKHLGGNGDDVVVVPETQPEAEAPS